MKKLLCFSLCFASLTCHAANQPLNVMLDWFVNPNHGPLIIAQQNGYFANHGLAVTISEPADPATPPKLAAAGKVDLALTYQPNLTIDVAAGLPLTRTATLIATPLNTLMVLKHSGIDSLAKLQGKTIGFSVAGSEEANVATMLASAGVDYSQVKMVNVGWALSASLASGKVDAIWGGFRNFETNQLAQEGYQALAFYPEEHGVPSYDELVFVANNQSKKMAAIAAFNQALSEATSYIVNHPEQAWQAFIAYAPDTLDTPLNHQAWLQTLPRFALRPQAVDLNRYDQYAAFLYQHQLITRLPSARDYVTTFTTAAPTQVKDEQ